jgi:hypothetical protein
LGYADSDYPTAIDPAPVSLRGGKDALPANALEFAINQIGGIQGAIGNDPTLFTSLGAIHFGTIAAFLLACFRLEGGTEVITGSGKDEFPVAFTSGRFSAPPVVLLCRQSGTSTEPGEYKHYSAKSVTADGFKIGTSDTVPSTITSVTLQWLAIQGPFGEESIEDVA